MLIDIPEQNNCADCEFCDYEFGKCFLASVIGIKDHDDEEWPYTRRYSNVFVTGENRPAWCPFKKQR